MSDKLVGHPTHDCEGQATVDPRVGLPLGNTGVGAVTPANTVKKLLGCEAKGAKDRESERHKVEAVASTNLGVLIPLRLLNNS